MAAVTAPPLAVPVRSGGRALDRAAGAGGLGFVALLVAQNAIRAGAPGFGASPAAVSSYFLDHRTAAIVPLGLFPLGLVALACFVAGVWNRTRDWDARWWANAGALAATAVMALFGLVNVMEIALVADAHRLAHSPDVVSALWAVHAGAFGLDLAAIAVALLGLAIATHSAGLVPRWLVRLAVPGAACLLVASVFTVALAEGAPWIALGLVGLVVWGVFLVVAGGALLLDHSFPRQERGER